MDTAVAFNSSTDSRSVGVSSTRVMSNGTVFLVHERGSRRRIKLEVCQPVTITSKEGLGWTTTFTSYLIQIDTNHYAFSLPYSEVRRRFSEFCWLHSKLAYHHPNKIVPPLPRKTFIYATKFNGNVIEQRCIGLGKFLQRVMRSSVFLSDAALHYFLQTNLSIKEIEEKLEAEIPVRSIPISQLNKPKKRPKFSRSISCSSSDSTSSERSVSSSDGDCEREPAAGEPDSDGSSIEIESCDSFPRS
ncbi:Sorting nexin-11 [Orchesella cincta]|uniref:Sorting nexin-11 n=1 Tax=Orchesella cincta TaxID=48709 RepID=A0A1D2N0D1_ORCCI|nr:Sorting nexin-11 [Orchesella cincta]